MLDYVEDVALDLACAIVNPDADTMHPLARKVACAAFAAVTLALMAYVYAQDGHLWM